jgi:hypothetical protein
MPTVKQIFAKKDFPSFITKHPIFKTVKTIKKIFPDIGLPNCEKIVTIDNTKEIKEHAEYLIDDLIYRLGNYITDSKRDQKLLKNLSQTLTSSITTKDGKVSLNLSKPVVNKDGKIVFKQGEGVFKVYNKVHKDYSQYLPRLDSLGQFKAFSSVNIPTAEHTIRFSSDGAEGLWDIATMSMRGIQSCQGWGKDYCSRLVGSMVDPFTGIMYLASGAKTQYGSKMLRRCVVRFVVNEKSKKPSIYIDRMYPEYSETVMNHFIAFIKEKTKSKFSIDAYDNYTSSIYNKVIPVSKAVSELDIEDRSYRDCEIDYEDEDEDGDGGYNNTLAEIIETGIEKSILSSIRKLKLIDIPENYKDKIKDVKNDPHEIRSIIEGADLYSTAPAYSTKSEFKNDLEDLKNQMDRKIQSILTVFLGRGKTTCNIRQKITTEASKKIITIIDRELAKLSTKKLSKSKYAKIYSKYL